MSTYIANPFQFEGIVTGANFCDKTEEIKELLEYMLGYGEWSTGNVSDEMVNEYLEHHRDSSNADRNSIILE